MPDLVGFAPGFRGEDPKLVRSEGVLALQLRVGVPMWREFKHIRLKQLK